MRRLISPGLSPNLEGRDVINALRMLFSFFSWKKGEYISKVETWFRYNFNTKYAVSFSQGREAEYALLISCGVKSGDEVIIQAFTCSAAIDPILWLDSVPIYVDISQDTYSMDPKDLKKKITNKTKAIIVQHTYGIPADIILIKKIASEHKVFLIEDCAHVINGINNSKKLGTYADAAFFSFGRDKAVSSVFGGIAITNKRKIGEKVKKIQSISPVVSAAWIFQQLLHPIFTYLIIVLYSLNSFLGKSTLYFLKKINAISKPFNMSNTKTYPSMVKTKCYPNALAFLVMDQLLRISNFNKKRQIIFEIYTSKLPSMLKLPQKLNTYLRVPALLSKRRSIIDALKKKDIYLGDWYSNLIDPYWVIKEDYGYKKRSCRTAEIISSRIINLPCYPRMIEDDAQRVVHAIKLYFSSLKPRSSKLGYKQLPYSITQKVSRRHSQSEKKKMAWA